MNKPCPSHECCCPGDRDDNLWITIDGYQPPKTQAEWEQTCFLDKCFHGYYKWPRVIKYPMNKRDRYCVDRMPEHVAVIYNRFRDQMFFTQLIQYMIIDEEGVEIGFDLHRFRIFKVRSTIFLSREKDRHSTFFLRVSFEIMESILWIILWNSCIFSFMKRGKKNKKEVIVLQLKW